jgi:hypothetical protein
VIKRLWGFQKVRYRGLAKNLARAYALFALSNLYLVRRRLLLGGRRAPCERAIEAAAWLQRPGSTWLEPCPPPAATRASSAARRQAGPVQSFPSSSLLCQGNDDQ